MFKICSLTLYSTIGETFTYQFSSGINYIKGTNDSGKTEFYYFLDFMFGRTDLGLDKRRWYTGTLKKAIMEIEHNSICYKLSRDITGQFNFINYSDEEEGERLSENDYRSKLNAIFTINAEALRELRSFSEEEISFRTFTLFNFWGEKGQGDLVNFFYKCRDIKYQIKLPLLLNYIFNPNLKQIFELKQHMEALKLQIERLEKYIIQSNDIRIRINQQLKILDAPCKFTGKNIGEVEQFLREIQGLILSKERKKRPKAISELETIYNSLSEQLKIQESEQRDHKSFEIENKRRKELLDNLRCLAQDKPQFEYLISPITQTIEELDKSISFNRYVIHDNTVNALKKELSLVREELSANKARFTIYSVQEKTKAIMLIRDYLPSYEESSPDELNDVKKELAKIKDKIKILQGSNDYEKINRLSANITKLYKSARAVSEIVDSDCLREGFLINYIKNGNILQPQILLTKETDDEPKQENFYTGSMARHTLIQLCGYLGFLKMLLEEKRYPIIPILIIDHISKQFDAKNQKAIGSVLNSAYSDLDKAELQVFMFGDKDSADIGIEPDSNINLVEGGRTGFNPFFKEKRVEENIEHQEIN